MDKLKQLWSDGLAYEEVQQLGKTSPDGTIYNLHEDICCLKEKIAELENFLNVARIPDAQEWRRKELRGER